MARPSRWRRRARRTACASSVGAAGSRRLLMEAVVSRMASRHGSMTAARFGLVAGRGRWKRRLTWGRRRADAYGLFVGTRRRRQSRAPSLPLLEESRRRSHRGGGDCDAGSLATIVGLVLLESGLGMDGRSMLFLSDEVIFSTGFCAGRHLRQGQGPTPVRLRDPKYHYKGTAQGRTCVFQRERYGNWALDQEEGVESTDVHYISISMQLSGQIMFQ